MSNLVNNDQFSLHDQEVQVWMLDVRMFRALLVKLSAWLDDAEKERAQRYVFAIDRERFSIARAILRYLLGRYVNQAPQSIVFSNHPYGKPFLTGPSLGSLEFNISHSHNLVLIAMTRQHLVGVDIEYHRSNVEFATIAQRYFTKNEYAWWQHLPKEESAAGFFKIWSSKEAVVKGLGLGLSYSLTSFEILHAPGVIKLADVVKEMPAQWYLENFAPEPDYSAAIAVAMTTPPSINWYRLTPDMIE